MAENQYNDRTDSLETKLRLLQQAWADGRHDLAMSLLESLKDTVAFERQRHPNPPQATIGAEEFLQVASMPAAWATWAGGWQFCKVVELRETAGIARQQEPVTIDIAFRETCVRICNANSG
ncbi:MAG: hypothetical protein O2782_16065 [bacterium]|nr:hypothetical protein [bacterium]